MKSLTKHIFSVDYPSVAIARMPCVVAGSTIMCSPQESTDNQTDASTEPSNIGVRSEKSSTPAKVSDAERFEPVVSVIDEVSSGVVYARDSVHTGTDTRETNSVRGITNIDFSI